MYRENNKGPRTVPWGTPDKTGAQSDFTPFTTTRCCLKQRKESIHFTVDLQPSNLLVLLLSEAKKRIYPLSQLIFSLLIY